MEHEAADEVSMATAMRTRRRHHQPLIFSGIAHDSYKVRRPDTRQPSSARDEHQGDQGTVPPTATREPAHEPS